MLNPCMRQALRIFQHGVARWITGRQPKRWEEGGREYPPLVSDMEEAGFEEIGDYILKRQSLEVIIAYARVWNHTIP